MDTRLDLESPQSFTEKIQYIKLYQRTALRKLVADRIQARKFVSDRIGEQHLIPLLGICEELDRRIWNELPETFVLKANHGCGMVEIVKCKSEHEFDTLWKKTETWRKTNYYKVGREWVYQGLPRKILAEELLLDDEGEIPEDFKFFCFDGRVEVIQIDFNRFGDQKRNLYDRDFNQLEARLLYPHYDKPVSKPGNLDRAIEIAETLSQNFNFIRVDLYLLDQDIYFGELTNYPGNGFKPFEPESMNMEMGRLLEL
ncbi:MAG: ATP-grasp fold amidoligase family protein [Balneolaceae bacterium]|nr:ATP-grasp fold amidoligase family protein [Balneolaceae bacterium]